MYKKLLCSAVICLFFPYSRTQNGMHNFGNNFKCFESKLDLIYKEALSLTEIYGDVVRT
jgi:hypothetical protein